MPIILIFFPPGSAALHIAAFYGFDDVIDILLDYRAVVKLLDTNGHTALHVSLEYSQGSIQGEGEVWGSHIHVYYLRGTA